MTLHELEDDVDEVKPAVVAEPIVPPHQIEFFFAKTAENGTKRLSYEGIMAPEEKMRRALADDWEFVGDPWQLCQILRAEIHRLQSAS